MKTAFAAVALVATMVLVSAFRVPPEEAYAAPDAAIASACAKEGETVGGSTLHAAHECCPGLTDVSTWNKPSNPSLAGMPCADILKMPPPPGSAGVCVHCGDGTCDNVRGEDHCNCPADCK